MDRSIHRLLRSLTALTVLCVSSWALAQSPQVLELQNDWKLASANTVTESGETISQPTYPPANWHPIRRMPGTVLAVLQEDGTYPNLYDGMNLLTKVPQDLWKQDWWYRTTFRIPAGSRVLWIDFPGINYRAQIWLNGKEVANEKEVVGMYSDHRFNVTQFVHPGQINALAVKVTPERLIQDVNGVELADSWQDWINWKYLGYHGPINPRYADTSSLEARYLAPSGSGPINSVTTNVVVNAATSTTESLQASITSDGLPVTKGTVLFRQDGRALGTAAVTPNGVATLEANRLFGGISYVPDRNAGIWKPVYLYMTGPVKLSNAFVETKLPLPATNPARLTVHVDVTNGSSTDVRGNIEGEITRTGKQTIHIRQSVDIPAGETREISFTPSAFPQLVVNNPDLWWPYTMGKPALYNLKLRFVDSREISDSEAIRFGIREVTQLRDQDENSRALGKGGNFYLQVNGKNFLIRGADYTPDLLFQYSPKREETAIRYTKDMGLNMLRWESKISSEHIVDLADEAGIPLMFGWMCCNQWEKWDQWSEEDHRVALESLRSQILMLRSHAAVFLWANGSDGLPPQPIRDAYHRMLTDLHWQNAVVDSAASHGRDEPWDGIRMRGPYAWRPPSYWFSERYVGAEGSCAEEGDNENIPPFESLKTFIPSDHLWPPNDYWYFHAGAIHGNSELLNTRLALDHRYGPSTSAEELAKKAQLGLYEGTRAQFEDFAANGWANHKMMLYWMLNSQWPSTFGHLFDYYERPGGAYYGAKKGLHPLSVVFDYYASGDHKSANISVVNQTMHDENNLVVRVRIYDLLGEVRYDQRVSHIDVSAQGVKVALVVPLIHDLTSMYFVRCELLHESGSQIADNDYWQSTTLDDLGSPANDDEFGLQQESWANFTALNEMPEVHLEVRGVLRASGATNNAVISLHNPSKHIAFFQRVELTNGRDGEEILPILYDDNYVTVFPGETVDVESTYDAQGRGANQPWLRVEGYNTPKEISPIQ